jgi:hypothetical protein
MSKSAPTRRLTRLQGVQWLDHPAQRDAGAEWRCLRSLLAGQAALLAVAAFRELRSRMTFLQVFCQALQTTLRQLWHCARLPGTGVNDGGRHLADARMMCSCSCTPRSAGSRCPASGRRCLPGCRGRCGRRHDVMRSGKRLPPCGVWGL